MFKWWFSYNQLFYLAIFVLFRCYFLVDPFCVCSSCLYVLLLELLHESILLLLQCEFLLFGLFFTLLLLTLFLSIRLTYSLTLFCFVQKVYCQIFHVYLLFCFLICHTSCWSILVQYSIFFLKYSLFIQLPLDFSLLLINFLSSLILGNWGLLLLCLFLQFPFVPLECWPLSLFFFQIWVAVTYTLIGFNIFINFWLMFDWFTKYWHNLILPQAHQELFS